MSAKAYFEAVELGLQRLRETQLSAIEQAAEAFCEAIAGGKRLFAFGATHSFIVPMEMIYRTGGLMLVNPIYPQGMDLSVRPLTMTSQIERVEGFGRVLLEGTPAQAGDVLLIASASGRNPIVIDMAVAAREMNMTVIGVLALDYCKSSTSRHSSGKLLHELCDIVIDECAPVGDAAVEIAGLAQKTGPLSTVLGCTAVNALVCEVLAKLMERGVTPPVFLSANLPGGDEHNARLLEGNRNRIFYL
ncbi:MAG: sugar isomerase domain-containing protein [Armatimonadota bacterium]